MTLVHIAHSVDPFFCWNPHSFKTLSLRREAWGPTKHVNATRVDADYTPRMRVWSSFYVPLHNMSGPPCAPPPRGRPALPYNSYWLSTPLLYPALNKVMSAHKTSPWSGRRLARQAAHILPDYRGFHEETFWAPCIASACIELLPHPTLKPSRTTSL